ncbi:uncharacterized protein DS421_8g231100 [Arachis hypogaea]|nr:uncharacterized protein DS421_8g231100 [Arachis hypogaea]
MDRDCSKPSSCMSLGVDHCCKCSLSLNCGSITAEEEDPIGDISDSILKGTIGGNWSVMEADFVERLQLDY